MAFTEILTSHTITVEQFSAQLFEEFTKMLWWKNLMGTDPDMPINVLEDLTKEPGDAITVQMMGQLEGGIVTGNSTGIGNEGSVSFFGQRIEIDNVRVLARIDDIPMTQKRTNFDVVAKVRRALAVRAKERLDEEITTALSGTGSRVRGRYLYGAVDSNWDATHSVALTNIDNGADQLTTSIIDICKRKAKLLTTNATAKIRPMRVVNGKNMEEWFSYIGHTLSIRDMVLSDASWKNAQLNIPPQSNSNSPLYTGSSFKGAWNGVLIYEYEELDLTSSTIQVCHNFLLGAQACAVAWGQRSKLGEEENDVGHRLTVEDHQIRGVEKLVFDRATPEDNGIVHSFVAAVAD